MIKNRVTRSCGVKNDVSIFLSVESMVIAPANTGIDESNKIAVIKSDQTNNGVLSDLIVEACIFIIVEIKLTFHKIDEIPSRCELKITKSTEGLLWARFEDRGRYTVQSVRATILMILLIIIQLY